MNKNVLINKVDYKFREITDCDNQFMIMGAILNRLSIEELKIILEATKLVIKSEAEEEKTNVAMGQQ
jgi:hypothetical protein